MILEMSTNLAHLPRNWAKWAELDVAKPSLYMKFIAT